ncbi:GntR family transcriptional regulator [Georgenia yuyongxinii]|uniref:GntR family transcriptional regulator n=1 Tax=Georgenia yuyongxinii TaxID=2589797 RepID=A0A5B8C6B3_9MICO|nr:GntR family transcriptional regulator [Georgenia yuyongxinii]QDC25747.1 GntR family transcriptional regulator [Georgenia yuyongxinii]
MQITPIKQDSLGEQVARELRHLIATRRVAGGTPVVEEALANQFGVSRGPVRDALRILAAEGLVTVRGRRAEIRGLTGTDIDELFSLRHMLESTALGLAMDRDPETLLAGLEAALRRMEAAVTTGGAEAFAQADLRFHSSFYLAAGHSRLTAIWAQYRPSIEMVLRSSRETYQDLAPSIGSHYTLADLIRAGDPGPALYELTEHLDNARRRVRTFYEAEVAAPAS